jgi:enoyl-CoA hydratase/carnithine racemase
MSLPKLPSKAAYLFINNARRRNALSLEVLRDLQKQLHALNTSPVDGRLCLLPQFKPEILDEIEDASKNPQGSKYGWLVDATAWQEHRKGLPNVIVLRSEGPVFSSGHDLKELSSLSHDEVKETFALCGQVMGMIRNSPAPVVGAIHGFATAAGAQLALSTDLPIACRSTQLRLPGASIGLPCTSPSTAVSRRLGNAFTYRMLALAEPIQAGDLPDGAIDLAMDADGFETRVAEVTNQLAENTAGQPQALGKWGYWTQAGISGRLTGGDGYEEAAMWSGRLMAVMAKTADAQEGIEAFFSKRKPNWVT